MKRLFNLVSLLAIVLTVHSCYDDSALWDSMENYEERILELESLCSDLNVNISSLQMLLTAVQQGDMVKEVIPIEENGRTGYRIEFLKTDPIIIYNGQDGEQGVQGEQGDKGEQGEPGVDVGATLDLGVKKHTDGEYYWTLNGEWLYDDENNMIKAVATAGPQGEKGEVGVTPKLKIVDGYWYVSYDNGATYEDEPLGKATGENGKDGASGGDPIFKSITEDASYVYFTLTDGTVFKIQKSAGSSLNILFDVEQGVSIVPETTLKVGYTVVGGDDKTIVRVHNAGLATSAIKPKDATSGDLYIYFYGYSEEEPDLDDPYFKDYGPEVSKRDCFEGMLTVFVSVSDGKGNSIVKALNIEQGKMTAVQDAFLAESVAGSVTAYVNTNVSEGSYNVSIPANAQSWLSYEPSTRASLRTDEFKFKVTANEGDKFRSAAVSIRNELGQTMGSFVIVQKSYNADAIVEFADPKVEAACVQRYDKDRSGDVTYEELALVTDIKGLFSEVGNIVSFNEFQYFTSVTTIPERMFEGNRTLAEITFPESLVTIESSAFNLCLSLTSIEFPAGLENIYGLAFAHSGLSGMLEIPASVRRIGHNAFKYTDITAVKMCPVEPPVERYYDEVSVLFDSDVIVYVADECVAAYKDTYSYQNCNIIPFSMINLRLELTCDNTKYTGTYKNGILSFPVDINLSGDLSEYPQVEEYGYYYSVRRRYNYDDPVYEYVPMTQIGEQEMKEISFEYVDGRYKWDEYEEYNAYQGVYLSYVRFYADMGVYVKMDDGSVIRLGDTPLNLSYATSDPILEFTSVTNPVLEGSRLSFNINYFGLNLFDPNLKNDGCWAYEFSDGSRGELYSEARFDDGIGTREVELWMDELGYIEKATSVALWYQSDNYRSSYIVLQISTDGTITVQSKDQVGFPSYCEEDYEFLTWMVENRAYGNATPTMDDLDAGNLDGFKGISFAQDAAGKWFVENIYYFANAENPSSNLFNAFPPTIDLPNLQRIYINCTADGTDAGTMADWTVCPLRGSELPTEWNCPNLWGIHLECTGMTGVISDSFAALPNLSVIFFRNNDFYGALPQTWGNPVGFERITLSFNGASADSPNLGYLLPADLDIMLNSEKPESPRESDLNMIQICGGNNKANWKGYENGWGQKRYVKFGGGADGDLTTWNAMRKPSAGTAEEIEHGGLRNPLGKDDAKFIDNWTGWWQCACNGIPEEMHEWNQADADAYTAEAAARARIF